MVWIMIDIPDPLNHEVEIYKAKNGLSSKDEAMIMALSKYFRLKYKGIYEEDEESDVKIKG